MQNNYFLVMAFIAITATSCSKELATNAIVESSTTSSKSSLSETADAVSSVSKLSLTLAGTNYGALIDASEVSSTDAYTFENSVAGQLGLSCIRDNAPVPGIKKVKMLISSYNILLNFTGSGTQPLRFRTDVSSYQNDLRNTIASLSSMPKIAVIENEESNKKYYSGSADDYIAQLKAAIPVMHSYGIPVTNGGITMVGLRYLVYQDYMNRGMVDQAKDYKMRMKVAVNNADTQERAAFINTLLTNYAKMNIDYVNFHWYSQSSADAQGLGETIDYLKRVTGKTIIINEIGQYDNDPSTLTATVQMCSNYNLPFVIWYSGEYGGRAYPLNYLSGDLTNTGYAYKKLIGG